MLKHFTVFQCRNPDDTPCCRALLCVGKSQSNALAYAWVDTIKDYGDLTITLVPHASTIELPRVIDAINALCNASCGSQEEAIAALHQHLIAKANDKLSSRAKWFKAQSRKYRTSHYASLDAAYALMPTFPLQDLSNRLHAEREDIDYAPPEHSQVLLGIEPPKPKWTWDDYREPADMLQIIKDHATEVPRDVQHKHPAVGNRLKKRFKEVRTKTAKLRLMHLLEIIRSMPTMNYKQYLSTQHKTEFPWHEVIPKWFRLNPAPLLPWDADKLAKLDYDTFMDLVAMQMTWLHRWYALQQRVRGAPAGEEVKEFYWSENLQEMVEADINYDTYKEWSECHES